MEWSAARLKFGVLAGASKEQSTSAENSTADHGLSGRSFGELCRIGFALTWPIALVGAGILIVLLLKH
jgi:hypothetical protein